MLIKDRNTVSLFHFDESASKDECGLYWETSGILSLSTDIHKFGNSSLNTTRGGYLHRPSVCDFGDNDFTIDFWVYGTDDNLGSRVIISNSEGLHLKFQYRKFMVTSSNGSPLLFTPLITNFKNKWHHYACVSKDGTGYLFVDGKIQAKGCSINWAPLVFYGSGQTFIGVNTNTTSEKLNYYLDELRISNIARWTNNFIPLDVNRLYEDKIDNYYGVLK